MICRSSEEVVQKMVFAIFSFNASLELHFARTRGALIYSYFIYFSLCVQLVMAGIAF